MDTFTKKKRSEIMSKIRSENTRPELLIFRELRKRRVYFQKHYSRIPGKPDIALVKKKIAIFIDGNFWHGYKFSKVKSKLPKRYWVQKIESNIMRDKKVRAKLKKMGWKVLRIWEHEATKKTDKTIQKIILFIN